MKALLVFLMMMVCFFAAHVLIWRYKQDWQSKRNLLIIVGVVFVTILLYRVTFFEFCLVGLAYGSVACSYFIFYLWLEGDSPSIHFIKVLSEHPNERVKVQTIKEYFAQHNPLTTRLEALVEDELCVYEPPNYRLTALGRQIAAFFEVMSRLFGMSLEG